MDCAGRGCGTPCATVPATRRCGNCGAVSYCSLSHQRSHWNDHKEECARLEQQMKRAEALNDFPFSFSTLACGEETRCSFLTSMGLHNAGLWSAECSCGPLVVSSNNSRINRDWHLPSSMCPCGEPRSPISTCLSNWKEYYQWRCLPLGSAVAVLLHWPLTIYHCLQLSSVTTLMPQLLSNLHIHYLGPSKELYQLEVLGELRALLPGTQLHVELIGPEVPDFRDGEGINLCSYLPCLDKGCSCNSNSLITFSAGACDECNHATVTLKLRKGFYHDRFSDILQDSYPHLVIAPNAGVAAYSSWLPTIRLIKEMGVPAIFTDFCEEAAYLAARCITSVTGCPLRLPIQVNPFRQPLVVEDVIYMKVVVGGVVPGNLGGGEVLNKKVSFLHTIGHPERPAM